MKATLTAIQLADAGNETLKRASVAMQEGIKRLSELGDLPEVERRLPRVQTSVDQIQTAMKTADIAAKTVRRLCLAALAISTTAQIELGDLELAALAYGLDVPQ